MLERYVLSDATTRRAELDAALRRFPLTRGCRYESTGGRVGKDHLQHGRFVMALSAHDWDAAIRGGFSELREAFERIYTLLSAERWSPRKKTSRRA